MSGRQALCEYWEKVLTQMSSNATWNRLRILKRFVEKESFRHSLLSRWERSLFPSFACNARSFRCQYKLRIDNWEMCFQTIGKYCNRQRQFVASALFYYIVFIVREICYVHQKVSDSFNFKNRNLCWISQYSVNTLRSILQSAPNIFIFVIIEDTK